MAKCKAKTNSGKRCKNNALDGSDYCHIPAHNPDAKDRDDKKLTLKQEKFCQLYVSKEFFANGTQAYAEAFNVDLSTSYNTAKVEASKLLTKPNICTRIDELLDDAGLNDNFVDKQLLLLIQQNSEFNPKLGAIREYNKVKGRITDKVEHSGNIGGQIVITGDRMDAKEWEEIARAHMKSMLQVVAEMKEAVDGGSEET
jgi:phage terminase small subunit